MNKAPFIKITPLFLAGIILGNTNSLPFNHLLVSLFILINTLHFLKKGSKGFIWSTLIFLQLVLLGVFHVKTTETFDNIPNNIIESNIDIRAEVIDIKQKGARNRVMLKVIEVRKQTNFNLEFNALLYTSCNRLQSIKPGQIIKLTNVHLQGLHKQVHQGYLKWLKQKKVTKVIWEENCLSFKIEPPTESSFLQNQRKRIIQIIHQLYEVENTRAIIEALIIGKKNNINDNLRTIYTKTGAIHILAISGLHVGLVFMIPFFLLKQITAKPIYRYSFSLLVVFLFVLLTGGGPSVMRAFFMLMTFSIGKMLTKQTSIYNVIYLTALILVIIDYQVLFQIGFQLSFMAVFGIISFQKRISEIINIKNKILDYVWQLNTVSIAAQLGTIGFSLFYFNAFALSFPLSGIIVIPLAPLILILGFSSVILFPINSFVAELLAGLNNGIVSFQNKVLTCLSQIDWLYLEKLRLDQLELLLYYIFFFWSVYTKKNQIHQKLIVGVIFMLIFSVTEFFKLTSS